MHKVKPPVKKNESDIRPDTAKPRLQTEAARPVSSRAVSSAQKSDSRPNSVLGERGGRPVSAVSARTLQNLSEVLSASKMPGERPSSSEGPSGGLVGRGSGLVGLPRDNMHKHLLSSETTAACYPTNPTKTEEILRPAVVTRYPGNLHHVVSETRFEGEHGPLLSTRVDVSPSSKVVGGHFRQGGYLASAHAEALDKMRSPEDRSAAVPPEAASSQSTSSQRRRMKPGDLIPPFAEGNNPFLAAVGSLEDISKTGNSTGMVSWSLGHAETHLGNDTGNTTTGVLKKDPQLGGMTRDRWVETNTPVGPGSLTQVQIREKLAAYERLVGKESGIPESCVHGVETRTERTKTASSTIIQLGHESRVLSKVCEPEKGPRRNHEEPEKIRTLGGGWVSAMRKGPEKPGRRKGNTPITSGGVSARPRSAYGRSKKPCIDLYGRKVTEFDDRNLRLDFTVDNILYLDCLKKQEEEQQRKIERLRQEKDREVRKMRTVLLKTI